MVYDATPTSFAGLALAMAPGTESGYKGVAKNGKGWKARKGPKDSRRCLGTFESKLEAAVSLALDAKGINLQEDKNPQFTDATTVEKPKGDLSHFARLPLHSRAYFSLI